MSKKPVNNINDGDEHIKISSNQTDDIAVNANDKVKSTTDISRQNGGNGSAPLSKLDVAKAEDIFEVHHSEQKENKQQAQNDALAKEKKSDAFSGAKQDEDDNKTSNVDDCDEDEDAKTELTEHLDDDDFEPETDDIEKKSIEALAKDDNISEPKSYASILVEQVIDAKKTFHRSLGSLFTSAFTAGLEIGISFLMILTVYSLVVDLVPKHYTFVLASLMYPIGFIIVVIGQSLLFTEQTSLLSLPVLNKIEPVGKLIRLWSVVIAGNLAGGCMFSILMIGLGLKMQLFKSEHLSAFGEHVLKYEWWVVLGSAILAGWLMGVAAWLVTSARDTFSRIVLVTIITSCIGILGLHHSIVGNVEVFSALIYGDSINILQYLWFLAVVLVGNTIGGVVFVAVLKNRAFMFDIEKLKKKISNREISSEF